MNAADWPELDGFDRSTTLEMFAIYERPLDYPKWFVVRRFFARGAEVFADVVPRLAPSLDEARALVPRDRVLLARREDDDAFLVENWI